MSAIPAPINMVALQTAVRKKVLTSYQHKTLLALFPSVPIPKGIAAEDWAQRYMKETKKAALHKRGFTPNQIKLDYSGYKLKPVTVDQSATLDEIDLAQYKESGMLPKFVPTVGENMAYTTNTFIMNGRGGNGEANPHPSQYNYLIAEGNGNGTATRPNLIYDASGGAWNTHATMRANIGAFVGSYVAGGGILASSVLLIPIAATPTIITIKSEYNDHNIEFYLKEAGIKKIVYVEDEFFATIVDGTTLATKDLFDIILFNPSECVVGYQRVETITSGKGPYPDRNFYIEGEVWFCFLLIPFRKTVGGVVKTFKHVARLKDITTS